MMAEYVELGRQLREAEPIASAAILRDHDMAISRWMYSAMSATLTFVYIDCSFADLPC